MQLRILFLALSAVLLPETARAEALAATGSAGSCLSAEVSALRPMDDGQVLYRIVFYNRCNLPRSFFWCAEHPYAQVPATVSCRSQHGPGADLRDAIRYRKEFQWHLPPGARIRYQDCPSQEIPTPDFSCAPQTKSTMQR
jgi:hypothetical protein